MDSVADELVVIQAGVEWRYALDTPSVSIGRGGHNDVVIADERASRAHARLTRAVDGWRVTLCRPVTCIHSVWRSSRC